MSKFFKWLARVFWVVVGAVGMWFLSGVLKKRTSRPAAQRILEQLDSQKQNLENQLQKLKEEAEHAEKKTHFDNPDDAARYLNDVLRRISDHSKK